MERLSIGYCERRAEEERRAAMEATCSEAAGIHRQLAEEYLARARALQGATTRDADGASAFNWKGKPHRTPIQMTSSASPKA